MWRNNFLRRTKDSSLQPWAYKRQLLKEAEDTGQAVRKAFESQLKDGEVCIDQISKRDLLELIDRLSLTQELLVDYMLKRDGL